MVTSFDIELVVGYSVGMINTIIGIGLLWIVIDKYDKGWADHLLISYSIMAWLFIINGIVFNLYVVVNFIPMYTIEHIIVGNILNIINIIPTSLIVILSIYYPQPKYTREKRKVITGVTIFITAMTISGLIFNQIRTPINDNGGGGDLVVDYVLNNTTYFIAYLFASYNWITEYKKNDNIHERTLLGYVLVGFLFYNISQFPHRISDVFRILTENLPVGYLFFSIQSVVLLLVIYYWLYQAFSKTKHTPEEMRTRNTIIGFFLIALMMGLSYNHLYFSESPHKVRNLVIFSTWATIRPIFFLYALFKYQFPTLDIKIKNTSKHLIIVVSIGIIFSFVERSLEEVIPLHGFLSAVIITLVIKPILDYSKKIVDYIFPSVEDSKEYISKRQDELYSYLLESLLEEGYGITSEKVQVLNERFDIDDGEARRRIALIEGVG